MSPGPIARRRAVVVAALLALPLCVAVGCRRPVEQAADVTVSMTVAPTPPIVGTAQVDVLLRDAAGAPVAARSVKLEGNMNHAGMKPTFADGAKVEEGHFRADLELTMGGDWFVLVDVVLDDGTAVQRKLDLPGVQWD